MDDELDPKEAARARRRDRDAAAQTRALLRPGMGKVFKQILDAQARAAGEAKKDHRTSSGGPSASARDRSERARSTAAPLTRPADPADPADPTDPA